MKTPLILSSMAEKYNVQMEYIEDEYMGFLAQCDSITEALWMLEVVLKLREDKLDEIEENEIYLATMHKAIENANQLFGVHAMVN
jgi:hypothetical protein